MPDRTPLDLEKIRATLSTSTGENYWRSLEAVAETPEFRAFVEREFPAGIRQPGLSRRRFLQLAASSLALAGLAACQSQPAAHLVPYVNQPQNVTPGIPQFYATAHVLNGFATGILVTSHTGHPTHIEGNPDHPASLGAADVFAQASILSLYDPERSKTVRNIGRDSTWADFDNAFRAALAGITSGQAIHILTPSVTSPTLIAQIQAFIQRYPQTQWHQYDPINHDNVYAGAKLAFGQTLQPVYQLEKADVILSLEDDFLFTDPGRLHYTRAFTDKRRVQNTQASMNRLYVVEGTPSITGSMADHRLPLRSSDVERFARALAGQLGLADVAPDSIPTEWNTWLKAIADDLTAHHGTGLVTAGQGQPPAVHALAHWMNTTLGNIGKTVSYIAPLVAERQTDSLRTLMEAMTTGTVSILLIIGGNPAYDASADIPFADGLQHVPFSAHLNLYEDETSALCSWHLPLPHDLETWSDVRAYDGTATILQPLILPLYDTRSPLELLERMLNDQPRDDRQIVQAYWQSTVPAGNFEPLWEKSLRDGVVANTASQTVPVTLGTIGLPAAPAVAEGLEIIIRPDPTLWDGRFNNTSWLQELPKPFTKLTWDNAAFVSPSTAQRLNLSNEDMVSLRYQGATLQAAIWILPGQADDCVTLTLGYGRTKTGAVGNGTGFNAYPLLMLPTWFGTGLDLERTGGHYTLVTTQDHFTLEGRDLIHAGTLDQFQQTPDLGYGTSNGQPSLYPPYPSGEYAWGMSVDLNTCVGCNACIIACQSENNIPVVGKDQVEAGREMHWLRVDGYFQGSLDNPNFAHQPVPCMHCEDAPCEPVCPVGATVHDSEGLNQMVYNRCVGTRYCSNNCPYKVRRFNFFDYADPDLRVINNPDVTVRSRGVMEKCTYCVQRISQAHIQSQREGRKIVDGEVKTACQTACPANAIVFGDISDSTTQVAQLKHDTRNYALLAELNTRPRTTYLAKLTNPNPALVSKTPSTGS